MAAIARVRFLRQITGATDILGRQGFQASARGFFAAAHLSPGSSSLDDGARGRRENWKVAKGLAAGAAASVSFAASMMSVAAAKERPPTDRMPKEVILYQYEACPFCNKVKAFLDYYDVPYRIVEVNPLGKKEIAWSEYKKVPILMVDGEQMNDSTEIISTLDGKLNPKRSPALTAAAKEEEEKWRKWVDGHLVHLLSPNIYRSTKEALQAFDYITREGNFTAWERATAKYAGAAAMYFISKRLKKRHNITDERAALYEAANTWVEALDNRSFMGGSKPNLADLAVFGVLRPIRNLDSGNDMIANSKIGAWYSRMEQAVGNSARVLAQESFKTQPVEMST
ncbi:prostaglandin E synthase 2 [Selaginella moellendorffii]|uniref:prostaglandin E synthase 2 n=1 Tax=Selaginella moellendorffii TaxID=88036 RepID=UPI000D1CCC6A|nr:prostaglandin E synthase 2 [Selaginella moellendorffii]|eukprot:XP_002993078.2 prostaglandin E synthase 2 [Selaginella moellendorffii]